MTANVAGALHLGITAGAGTGQEGQEGAEGVMHRKSDGVLDRVSARGYTSENTVLRSSGETLNEVLRHARNESM